MNQLDPEVMKLSVVFIYTIGLGNKKLGKKQQNAKFSCSKNVSMPSRDWIHMKSLDNDPPKGPTVKLKADRFKLCS